MKEAKRSTYRLWLVNFAIVFLLSLLLSGCSPTSLPTVKPISPPPSLTTSTAPATLPPGQEPIEITSVVGPVEPINPGGPIVETTLKNVAVEPVIYLTATLETQTFETRTFIFTFNVTPSNPLLPDKSTTARTIMIGSGFSDNVSLPLTTNGTLQSGATFTYTKQVFIVPPVK